MQYLYLLALLASGCTAIDAETRAAQPELFKDPRDAEAYAALMRQLPIHNEEDDPDLVAVFKEREDFLEAM